MALMLHHTTHGLSSERETGDGTKVCSQGHSFLGCRLAKSSPYSIVSGTEVEGDKVRNKARDTQLIPQIPKSPHSAPPWDAGLHTVSTPAKPWGDHGSTFPRSSTGP